MPRIHLAAACTRTSSSLISGQRGRSCNTGWFEYSPLAYLARKIADGGCTHDRMPLSSVASRLTLTKVTSSITSRSSLIRLVVKAGFLAIQPGTCDRNGVSSSLPRGECASRVHADRSANSPLELPTCSQEQKAGFLGLFDSCRGVVLAPPAESLKRTAGRTCIAP